MSILTFQMKTHSREDLTNQFPDLNQCSIHGTRPSIQKIVAGKRKEAHFVALCSGGKDCNKITMDSAEKVVEIWNKFNN